MRILFDIQKKYEETEIHICSSGRSEEVMTLKESLERLLLTNITVYSDHEARNVSTADIVRIYSESKKVFVRTGSEIYEVRERLYALEELLGDRGFVRISNSEIVNISFIEKLDMGYSGTIKIYMKNGDETFVSRRYVSKIRDELRRDR